MIYIIFFDDILPEKLFSHVESLHKLNLIDEHPFNTENSSSMLPLRQRV
jgi:hypothetical protein